MFNIFFNFFFFIKEKNSFIQLKQLPLIVYTTSFQIFFCNKKTLILCLDVHSKTKQLKMLNHIFLKKFL